MEERPEDSPGDGRDRLLEVARVFLKLGVIGFGGPAAHVSLMQEELVRRRKWVDRQEFLDLLGLVHLIPGPNSTEMALHLGGRRAGWPGLAVAGVGFILPAFLSVLALAWAYLHFGSRPEIDWILDGIKPVVLALIVRAVGDLSRTAMKGSVTFAAATLTLALALWGMDPVVILLVMAVASAAIQAGSGFRLGALGLLAGGAPAAGSVPGAVPLDLPALFLAFLKFGSVVFGSGYVLLAFLRADLVVENAWLTDRELLDAIAVGQLTPGPVFTTATFIGYLLAGVPGALVATAGIFLPSFFLVAATRPLLPRLRESPLARAFLDGANAAALSLMVFVTLELAREALAAPLPMVLAAAAMLALWFTRIGPGWLVLAGAAAGVLFGGS